MPIRHPSGCISEQLYNESGTQEKAGQETDGHHRRVFQPQVWVRVCEEQVKTEPSSGDGRMMRMHITRVGYCLPE